MAVDLEPGSTCQVLVVEDDFDSAEMLCIWIEQAGHACRVALSASEARAVIEDFTPDVALVDIGLPGESGYDLLESLKSSGALGACRFIAMTGYTGSDLAKLSVDAGFEAHLTKPVSVDLLLGVLDRCAGDLSARLA
ncbi:MAG TPA: response regulator [Polyangiaceae bacterium]|nr:response regulator [Polyangiaceae bacterium]